MIRLSRDQARTLIGWFQPERPGPVIGSHILRTSNGTFLVDHWPDPRVVLAETGGNYALMGDPHAITPMDIQPHIKGFVAAPESFLPLLRTAFPSLVVWPRIVLVQSEVPLPAQAKIGSVRRLCPADAPSLHRLDTEAAWIFKTWGSPAGLAESGYAWGVLLAEEVISVACTFFLGNRYEDVGVITASKFRRMGLSTACAARLCDEIHARGHVPSWTTSPDNLPSLRVAEKLGFIWHHNEVLYVIGVDIPRSNL